MVHLIPVVILYKEVGGNKAYIKICLLKCVYIYNAHHSTDSMYSYASTVLAYSFNVNVKTSEDYIVMNGLYLFLSFLGWENSHH